jgi:hypothetical protein
MDTNNYFYCKCSICFENDSEMEFINCGDQYCLPCLERYVEYWIKEGSWGLLPIELGCPVCGSEMLDDDWMPYVSGKTMTTWNKFQLKRKELLKNFEISRFCPICNNSQILIGSSHKTISDLKMITDCLITNLDKSSLRSWRTIFSLEQVVQLFQDGNLMDLLDFIESCQDLFDEFLVLIENLKRTEFEYFDQDLIRILMEFGRSFLYLFSYEINEEEEIGGIALIDMQLNFQSVFHFGHCDSCNLDFCLPCQYPGWFHQNHPKLSVNIRPDGSKQCPRCFVSIEKDPEGCNEIRCNYCGMKFCWECGKKWSKDCGIYICKNGFNEDIKIPRSEIKSEEDVDVIHISRDPEIGVPNVHLIHSNSNNIKY